MIKQARFLLYCSVLGILASCNLPARPYSDPGEQTVAPQYKTVVSLLTETAQGFPTLTPLVQDLATTQAPLATSTQMVVEMTVTPTPRHARLATATSATNTPDAAGGQNEV